MSDHHGAMPLAFLQQKLARPIDPDQLELMGKAAASLYESSGKDLTDAVVEVSKTAMLAPEQIKRVCEFANTSAYLAAFEKGGEVRNITFSGGPADPGRALRDLNDGSNPAIQHVESSDYSSPVGSYKTAGAGMSKIASAFGYSMESITKTASATQTDHTRHANPVDDLYDLQVRLESVRDDLKTKLSMSRILLEDVSDDLGKTAAQELHNGSTLGDVLKSFMQLTDNKEICKTAMVTVGTYALDRVFRTSNEVKDSLNKVASAGTVADKSHPLLVKFAAYADISTGHQRLEEGLRIVCKDIAANNSKLMEIIR